ncbi:MAG: hypothetical protein ACYSUI_16610 [Planctomycetota bacterium]
MAAAWPAASPRTSCRQPGGAGTAVGSCRWTTEIPRSPAGLRLSEILADPKADRPVENTRRNIDYPEILGRAAANRTVRRVFTFLCETASAGKQVDLARELGVSAPRVCQLKAELADILAAYGYEPPRLGQTAKLPTKRGRPAGESRRRLRESPLNAGTSPAAGPCRKPESPRRESRHSAAG